MSNNFESEIKHIKRNKSFLREDEFNKLRNRFKNSKDKKLIKFYKEIKFLKEFSDELNDYNSKFDFTLKKTDIVDLLIHMSLYYEKIRLDKESRTGIESNEENLISTFNKILNKKKSIGNLTMDNMFNGKKFMKKMEMAIKKTKTNKKIHKLINSYDQLEQFNYLLDLYCVRAWKIEFISDTEIILKPDNVGNYKKWIKNGYKYLDWRKWHLFAVKLLPDRLEYIRKYTNNRYNMQTEYNSLSNLIQYLDTGLPEKVKFDGNKEFDIENYFGLANTLSSNVNARYLDRFKYYSGKKGFDRKDYLEKISYIIHSEMMRGRITGPLMYRTEDFLVDKSTTNCCSNHGEIADILDFMSNNLEKANDIIDLSLKRFIKINDFYFWISGILANQNYAVVLQNSLMKRKLIDHRKISDSMEEKLLNLFKKNNFKTSSGYEYDTLTNNNKIDGEIDLLAFKDNTLFVIELKTTYARSTVREITYHEERTLNEKADEQLDRASRFIEKCFDEVQEELKFDTPYDDIIVYFLAVSTSFEGDYNLINDKYRKISLFELELILNNQLYVMFFDELYGYNDTSMQNIDKNKNIDNREDLKEFSQKYNLWSQSGECSSGSLISAIEEDKVWKHLDKKSYKQHTGEIETVNLKVKYDY